MTVCNVMLQTPTRPKSRYKKIKSEETRGDLVT